MLAIKLHKDILVIGENPLLHLGVKYLKEITEYLLFTSQKHIFFQAWTEQIELHSYHKMNCVIPT